MDRSLPTTHFWTLRQFHILESVLTSSHKSSLFHFPGLLIKERNCAPPPLLFTQCHAVVYVPVKPNKKRSKWQHHLESALLKRWNREVDDGCFPVDFNQLLYITGLPLSAAPRQQLLEYLNMPTQVPMGIKSQVSGSPWTALMMDQAWVFIACAASGLETKKSSYFGIHFEPEGETKTPQHGMATTKV